MKKLIDKLKNSLTDQEIDNLFGHIVYNYEMMRFNGTPAMVKQVYGREVKARDDVYYIDPGHHDDYILEKTRKFFDIGSPFATRLDSLNIVRLGGVVKAFINKEMKALYNLND